MKIWRWFRKAIVPAQPVVAPEQVEPDEYWRALRMSDWKGDPFSGDERDED